MLNRKSKNGSSEPSSGHPSIDRGESTGHAGSQKPMNVHTNDHAATEKEPLPEMMLASWPD